MKEVFHLRVYGSPVPQGRPRLAVIAGHAHAYDPGKSKDWKRTVHHEASKVVSGDSARFPLQGALRVEIGFFMPIPKTLPKRITQHTKRPDLDNLAKAAMDALSGCVYRDDAQIVALHLSKHYDGNPGVAITIYELEGGR